MATNALFTEREVALLDYTINTREHLIQKLTENGNAPEKSADKMLLVQLLDGVDKAIHTKAKLKIEDSNSQQQEQTSAMIGELLRRIDPKEYVAVSRGINDKRDIPVTICVVDKLPGEVDITPAQLTYETFMGLDSSD